MRNCKIKKVIVKLTNPGRMKEEVSCVEQERWGYL